jgi:CheY-like chemotaxis protein
LARVLVVDDNEVVITLITVLVEQMGHDVVTARNGIDALEAHERQAADLVITDIYMPDMDGLELIRRIGAKSGPPIIAMSGGASTIRMDVLPTAGRFGAASVIYKPIDLEALAALVTRLLTPA